MNSSFMDYRNPNLGSVHTGWMSWAAQPVSPSPGPKPKCHAPTKSLGKKLGLEIIIYIIGF